MAAADVPSTTHVYGSAPGEKGLKTGSLGLISSIVMGMASTAPAYSLASALGFVVATVALQSPIIMLLAFVPMYMIAVAYKELNEAEPDCGTTFTWATRAFGVELGLDGRLGDLRRRRDRDGEPRADRRLLRLPAGRRRPPRHLEPVGDRGRHHLDRRHDLDLVDRDRDLGQAAVPAAGDRGRDPRPAGGHRAGQGLLGQRRRRVEPDPALVVQPVQHLLAGRVCRRHPGRRLHLLGLGHRGGLQRGDGRRQPHAGPGRRHLDRAAAGDLRDRHRSARRPGPAPAAPASASPTRPTRTTC